MSKKTDKQYSVGVLLSYDFDKVKNRRKVFNKTSWCDEVFDEDIQEWVAVTWTTDWVDLTPSEQGDVEIYPLEMRDKEE